MTKKVLIADDSQTIQKVIKITLGDKNWELLACNNESELVSSLGQQLFDLILLDFGLSETKSGYQLCKEIHGKNKSTNIVILFGTFDTIDERLLKDSGATDKIVKPFDSQKFSALCESLLAVTETQDENSVLFVSERDKTKEFAVDKKALENVPPSQPDSEESWVLEGAVQSPVELSLNDIDVEKTDKSDSPIDPLKFEFSDWGLEVPGVIGSQTQDQVSGFEELPPVLEEDAPSELKKDVKDVFPNAMDLEYPDVGVVNEQSLENLVEEESHSDLSHIKLDTDFVALPAEVVQENLEELQDDPTNPSFRFEDVKRSAHLQEKLYNEESSETFWSVDDDQSVTSKNPETEKSEKADTQLSRNVSTSIVDTAQLRVMIREVVEEVVREQIKKHVEKIAWDIIPDLAEKLIAKELKSISDQVLGSDHPN